MLKTSKSLLVFTVILSFISLPNLSKAHQLELQKFDTDFCTAWPEGTREHPMLWAHCCVAHDLAFWVGGNKQDKLRADKRLRSCVSKVASPAMGQIMFIGIQLGYLSPIKGPYRWGWGWNGNTDYYRTLDEDEREFARDRLLSMDNYPEALIDEFIDFRFNQN